MVRKQFIILTALVVVIGLYLLFAALWDRSDPKAAMLHDVSANFTIYLTYNSTDYAEGDSIDINEGAEEEFIVKVKRNSDGVWVTDDWDVFHYAWLNAGTFYDRYAKIKSQQNKKIYYHLAGDNNAVCREVVGGLNASAEFISGAFTLY